MNEVVMVVTDSPDRVREVCERLGEIHDWPTVIFSIGNERWIIMLSLSEDHVAALKAEALGEIVERWDDLPEDILQRIARKAVCRAANSESRAALAKLTNADVRAAELHSIATVTETIPLDEPVPADAVAINPYVPPIEFAGVAWKRACPVGGKSIDDSSGVGAVGIV